MNQKKSNSIRILFVPDRITGEDSGARSARFTVKTLLSLGYKVGIYCKDIETNTNELEGEPSTYFRLTSNMKFYTHYFDPKLLKEAKYIMDNFKPDYVFFAGSMQKPSIIAREARKRAIKTIFLFYITDYYCFKVYAGLKNGPCFLCVEKGSVEAIKNGCIKQSPKLLHYAKGWLSRKRFKEEVINSFRVVGYSDDQLDVYKIYGIREKQCAKIVFQFDPGELNHWSSEDHGYFLLLGQATVEKGWHTLANIFSKCRSDIKIKIVFRDLRTAHEMLKKYGLWNLFENGQIEIVCEVWERKELLTLIAFARGVIIPSYYPTTGEFVLLESLLLGKPVVVFDVGAHKKIISHRVNGMVATVGDFEMFSKNIDEINVNSILRESVSVGAKELAQTIMSVELNKYQLTNLFS